MKLHRKKRRRCAKLGQPELLERRQLLAAEPIVVNYALDSAHHDNGEQETTLREALALAAANPGADTITFAPSLSFSTILVTDGELIVNSDVTIDASTIGILRVGREIGETASHRIFNVSLGSSVTMKNLIIQGGTARDGQFGGGILSNGNLTLIDSMVGGNTQFTRRDDRLIDHLGGGGGIYNGPPGRLELDNTHVGELIINKDVLAGLSISGVSLTSDYTLIPGNIAQGVGGGILNRGHVTVKRGSAIRGNDSNHLGGGIYNTGTVEVLDSQVAGNSATLGPGGGIASSNSRPTRYSPTQSTYTSLSTVSNPVSVSIQRSDISTNRARHGGGIYSAGTSKLDASDTEFVKNNASSTGGGIYSTSQAVVTRSLFYKNHASSRGGAISIQAGTATVDTSTVAGNTGPEAIYLEAPLRLQSSTITDNGRVGVLVQTGNLNGSLTTYNSIMSGNGANDVSLNFPTNASFRSLGHNLLGTMQGHQTVWDANRHLLGTDVRSTNPGLGPLGDYGGPTRTIGLLPNSPALNSGPTFGLASIDQRGESRIVGPRADRGSFESTPLLSMEVDSFDGAADGYYAPGEVSLSDAVAWANAVPGADTITFSENLLERIEKELGGQTTIQLHSQITITDDLTIVGPGADVLTLSGRHQHRVLQIDSGVSVSLSDLTLADGRSESGGAIRNAGNLELDRVEVKDSVSTDLGGGIWSGAGSTLAMRSSTVAGNLAQRGGGLYMSRKATIENSTIVENVAVQQGGGFLASGTGNITIQHSTITRNNGGQSGGGFRAQNNAVVQLGNTVIARNQAGSDPDYSDARDAVSLGYNFIGDIDRASSPLRSFNTNKGDQLGGGKFGEPLDPLLGPLRELGGPTRSVGILPTSPLIDRADPNSTFTFDQRGDTRPFGERNDIGAFEYLPPQIDGALIRVDSLNPVADGYFANGELSLSEAVLFAAERAGENTIEFDAALFVDEAGEPIARTIMPDRTLHISDSVKLIGPGAGLLTIKSHASNHGGTLIEVSVKDGDVASISHVTLDGADNARVISNNAGNLELTDVYVTDGRADQGAGLFNAGSTVLRRSTIANHASFSLVGENVSEEILGGAIHNTGELVAVNSTISSNTGGGIWNLPGGMLQLQQSTIANNDIGVGNRSETTLQSTLIAANAADVLNQSTVTSLGHNLIGAMTEGSEALGLVNTDLTDSSPELTGLLSIQGSIPMHGLLPSSPAIDSGGFSGESFDQRGRSRPLQQANDIGAFEAKEFFWTDGLVVTDLSDTLDAEYEEGLSLREAILWANRKNASNLGADEPDVITLSTDLATELLDGFANHNTSSTIALQDHHEADLIISSPLEISPFRDVDRSIPNEALHVTSAGTHRVFTVLGSAGSVLIEDVTVNGGGNVHLGGGIYTAAELELTNVTVRNNASRTNGGGVYVEQEASLVLDRSRIANNRSTNGAGIYVGTDAQLDVAYSSVEDNRAAATAGENAGLGGGLLNYGSVVVMSSTFSGNTARTGGAITSLGPHLHIDNGTISGNQARYGGALSTDNTTVINNSTITNNETIVDGQTSFGDGIAIRNHGDLQFNNSILYGNRAQGNEQLNNVFNEGAIAQVTMVGSIYSESSDDAKMDPMLLPLADNGGPTRTHALKPDSPAIDAGDPNIAPILDQRGRPIVDIASKANERGGAVDIGAFEVQSVVRSSWDYSAHGRSQFGEGSATIVGFGFDDGTNNSLVNSDPIFIGIPFDTGPMTLGGIGDVLGAKFGGELRADFAGRLGFDVGMYVNSGSVDVDYEGMLNYVIDQDPESGVIDVGTFFNVDDGNLYTISPKVGAYMDLVIELDANIGAAGCLFGCVGFDIPFKVNESIELFAVNRQARDGDGNLYFDGDIRMGGGSFLSAKRRESEIDDDDDAAANRLADANRRSAEANKEVQRINKEARARGWDPHSLGNSAEEQELRKRREAAIDLEIAAEKDKKSFDEDVTEDNPACNGRRPIGNKRIKKGLDVHFGQSEGSLLGAQATLSAAAEIDLGGCESLGLSKEIGSIAVTLPDINLSDTTPNGPNGFLSATTESFVKGSELDEKRQLAKIQVDAGGLLGPMLGIPAGVYSATLGPLAVSAQLVSYDIGPQLNVTQDVDATWYAKRVTFELIGDKPTVLVDSEPIELDGKQRFSFRPGQDVKIVPSSDKMIEVVPSITMDAKFTNDFGLDIDLQGALEAFSLDLQVGGVTVVDIGPLIT